MKQATANIQELSQPIKLIAEQVRATVGHRILGDREAYLTVESRFETALLDGELGYYERTNATEYISKRISITFEDNSTCNLTVRLHRKSSRDIVVQAQRFMQVFINECGLTRAVWTLEDCNTVHFTKNTKGIKNIKSRLMNYLDYFFGI